MSDWIDGAAGQAISIIISGLDLPKAEKRQPENYYNLRIARKANRHFWAKTAKMLKRLLTAGKHERARGKKDKRN